MTMARTLADRRRDAGFLLLFLLGYFKKAVIADNIAPLVDPVFAAPGEYGAGMRCWRPSATPCRSTATSPATPTWRSRLAGLLGYQLLPNFDQPYLAATSSSSGAAGTSAVTWLRDYLYIPLGGNRHGERKRPQSHDHHAARRPVARRDLDLRRLGRAARGGAGG